MCRFALLILPALLWVGNGFTGEDLAKKDLQLFQGSWQAAFIQNPDGQRAAAEDIQATKLLVKGNEFTFTTKNATLRGTFTIDPTKTPKAIDVMLEGAKPGDKLLGVYHIEGDVRSSCFAMPGVARPRAIRPAESGYLMLEWKKRTP